MPLPLDSSNSPSTENSSSPRPPRQQPGSACKECRIRKLRCDRQKPRCGACITTDVNCVIKTDHARRGPKKGHIRALQGQIAELQARLLDQEKETGADSDRSALSHGANNEVGDTCGYNTLLFSPMRSTGVSPDFGADSAWLTPTIHQPFCPALINNAAYSHPTPDTPTMKPGLLESFLTDLVCVDFDQLYFDRIYAFAPMVQRSRYLTWARNPDKTRQQACLQYAMWTLASSFSSQFQPIRHELYLEARHILDALDMVGPEDSLSSIEQAQAWVLLTIYELTCEDYRRGLVSAGRAFRLVQVMKLHQIDKEPSPTSQFDAIDLESMRRTFWSAHTLDRLVSVIDGLPMTFNEREIITCLPAPDSHIMINAFPTAMTLLSKVLNQADDKMFHDDFMGVDMPPFLEIVVTATVCGWVLDHKSRIPVEDEQQDTVQEFWRQHQSLNRFLRSRIQVLSIDISSSVRLPDPMIVFAALTANVTMLMLWEIVESKLKGIAVPHNVLLEQKQALLTAVRELERLTRTLTQLNYFQEPDFVSHMLDLMILPKH